MSIANRRLTNPLQNRISTTQAISAELRTAIVDGRLAPGQALRQETLAQHFNVSHIPIREALRQLESEGWVQIEQNKGATVSPLDAGEAREIYEMRAVLECHLLRLAIPAHDAGSLKAARAKLLTASRERDPNLYVRRNEEFHVALLSPAPRPHTLGGNRSSASSQRTLSAAEIPAAESQTRVRSRTSRAARGLRTTGRTRCGEDHVAASSRHRRTARTTS